MSSPLTRGELRKALRHDLRSPLSVIMGRTELVLSGVYGEVNADQRRSLEVVMRHAERLTSELEALAEALDRGPDPTGG